jgi:hypothetical protein
MPRTSELDERLLGVYRQATERIRLQREAAIQRTQAAMKPTPGWQAAAKAAAAQSVLEATSAECEALVKKLVEAHLDSEERDAERVTMAVREWLNDLTVPGLEFFQASGPEATALVPIALRHEVEFEAFRDRLAGEVAERFRASLAERVPRTPLRSETRTPWRRLRESPLAFGFFVVTTGLSLAGVSWIDVIRRALAVL